MAEADLPDELLARFLSGEASAADRVAIETWAAAEPAHRALLDRLLAATAPPVSGSWDVDRAWRQTVEVIRAPEKPVMVAVMRRRHLSPMVLRIAAVLLVAVGLLFAMRQLDRPSSPTEYVTAPGERRELSLADGTMVVLGPSSSLRVPADFGSDTRRVHLEGEGWFRATHQETALEVESGEYLIRDIGTVFTVAAQPNAALRVVVVEGEVQVRVAADSLSLLASLVAGDVGDFVRPAANLEAEAVIAREQPVASLTSWRTGSLELVDAPVQSVVDRLAAWHGVTIDMAPEYSAGRSITATLPLDSLEAALDILAPLLGAQAVHGPDGWRLQ
jgi:transmembrane sensor